MRATPRLLVAALSAIAFTAAAVAPPAGAQDESTTTTESASTTDSTTTTTTTTTTSTTTTSTTTTSTTTTTAAPRPPADASQTAARGSSAQVTETQPPPPAAPPGAEIPPDSGSGRRAVYSKGRMRVWLIEADGSLTRTYRVSGRMDQPRPGTYQVFSRSPHTCAMKRPDICMRFMVRFTKAFSGDNIGFHEIPVRAGGGPLQSDAQLGQPLSGGCVRQSTADAIFMWHWAPVGTTVVVVP